MPFGGVVGRNPWGVDKNQTKRMKKALTIILLAIAALPALAQGGMGDDQVAALVAKEYKAGTSEQQIVIKLMQSGVGMEQIRRVKAKYERQLKQSGMGVVADQAVDRAEDRMRKANGEKKKNAKKNTTKRELPDQSWSNTYDEEDEQYMMMLQEVQGMLPEDTVEMYKDLVEKERKKDPKVFGRDIFNKKNLTFEPAMNIATPQDYRLGPGDAVIVDIYGASQKSVQETVSPDGAVTIEGYGPVQVAGLTVEQANARLRSQLGSRYSSSKVKLTVGQTRTITINVWGEVQTPGTYTLSAFATVFHALYMAGGPSEIGTLRDIKVYRNNRLVTSVDVYDYILNGKLSGNVRLADNDVIMVGAYDCLVNMAGKVKRPMFYEMKRSESLATALKYAGGFANDAYTKSVRVVRKTGREYSVFNVGEFDAGAFHMADGDSVSVDSILPRFANTVEVKGAVFRPGQYQLGGGINSVRTLLEHAEGPMEDAFTARGVMHRMKPDRTLEAMAVDVAGILAGTAPDVPLRENDVLFIPTKSETQTKRTITIHGEVHYPGVYEYAEGETLEDFVLQAGGLNDAASTVKVDVARRISDPSATSPDSVISHVFSMKLKDGFVVDGTPGFVLMPFDEVYVRRSPGYYEQKNVYVEGQVMFAGTYTLSEKNERLSDVIRKAGGLNDLAYAPGARLERNMDNMERTRRKQLLDMAAKQSGKDSVDVSKIDLGDTYQVGIELDKALARPGGDADIVLRAGDRIIVPEYNATVKISGEVMYPNTVSYERGRRASWYIDQAGGWGNRAKKSHTFILYSNGTVARVGHGARVRPGCEIVVPSKQQSNVMKLTEWLSIGTSMASIATVIATIANMLK